MALRTITTLIVRPLSWLIGLRQYNSYISILRAQHFSLPVADEFLLSRSASLVNPRNHRVVTDQVSMNLPASSISGLDDETVLALFTKGFFGGLIFTPERLFMRAGGWNISPTHYTGFKSSQTEKVIWKRSDIPSTTLIPIGDVLSGSFKLIDAHLKTLLDTSPSYVDFGFGSDTSRFGGCHRFSVHRPTVQGGDTDREEQMEIRLEHFRCNPMEDVDSWAEHITWVHYWYAKLLFADGIRSLLRRSEI